MTSQGSVPFASALLVLTAVASGCYEDAPAGVDTDTVDTEGTSTGDGVDTTTTTNSGQTGETGAVDDTGTDTEGRPPGVEAARMLLEPLVAAQCENTFSCCDADEVAYQLGGAVVDAADCTERTLDVLEAGGYPPYLQTSSLYFGGLLGLFAYGVDDSVIEADEAAIAACVAALGEKPCAPSTATGANCSPAETGVLEQCDFRTLFIGSKGAGESCTSYTGLECEPGLVCDFFGSTGGVCVQTLSQGDICFQDNDCAQGLICDYAAGQCSVPADAGEACAYADPENPRFGTETTRCRSGLVCNPVSETCGARDCNFGDYCNDSDAACPEGLACVAARCDLLGVEGDDCYEDDDCVQGRCNSLEGTSVCQNLVANGGSCGSETDCESGFCDPTSSECAAQVAIGDACDGPSAYECNGGYCDGIVCVAFAAIGEDCTAAICNSIEGDQCVEDICQPYPRPDGQTCSGGFQCQSGLCDETCQPRAEVGDDCVPDACVEGAYCSAFTDGVCEAKKGWGAPCSSNLECWGSCESAFGELRCYGQGLGEALCDGV